MPRKTTFKKIGRSQQGKTSSDFALEPITNEEQNTYEFDIDTMTNIPDDTKQKKFVNPKAYFLICFATKCLFSNPYIYSKKASRNQKMTI